MSPKVKRKNAEDTKKDNGLNIKTKLESKNIKESPKKDKTTSNKENEIENPKEESKLSITNTNISMNNGKKSDEKILIIKDDSKNFIREKSEIINEINKILNQEKLNEELLIENIKILLDDYPAINKFDKVKSELLSKDDFEIFDDKINNKKFLFKVNLNNIISVANLLWEESNKSSTLFVNYLIKLDIYFSFVKDENSSCIDFVIITPISNNLYNFISTYGKFIFEDKYFIDGANEYINFSDKYQYDTGYFFEDVNCINLINMIGESNCKVLPKVMYYIKEKAASKLIDLKIINPPQKFNFHDITKDNKQYHGYNECDLIINMLEKVNIQENENFKFITKESSNSDTIKLFKDENNEKYGKEKKENSSLEMLKGHFYFFEFKNEVSDIKNNRLKIEKNYLRFKEALTNIKITHGLNFNIKNAHLILFCDKNYNDVKKAIKVTKLRNNLVYSNPQIGLNILLKFNKKIKYLTHNVDLINNELEEQKEKFMLQEKMIENQKNEFKKELDEQKKMISDLIEENKKIREANELQLSLCEFESYKYALSNFYYPLKIESLFDSKNLDKLIDLNRCENCYDCFLTLSKPFLKLREKNNLLCFGINKYIGQYIIKKEDKDAWMDLKNEIKKKLQNNNAKISYYYEGLLLFLFGKNNEVNEDYDILSTNNNTIRTYVKNLVNFLSLFEEIYNSNIENVEAKFQIVIIYVAYKLKGLDYISKKFQITKDGKKKKLKSEKDILKEKRQIIKELISELGEK